MDIFGILTLFGGLAMFLYGMRLMGDGLKQSSSGTLKLAMEKVTGNPFKALLLGALVTAIIQSSTATIVITSGLVAAGILSLRQSLGIVIGANVGTTVTGQIIRLLDIDSSAAGILQLFRPSTLAPIALIAGIVMIMGMKFRNAKTIGNILMGFGILFSGLMNMTGAVDSLSETGIFDRLFESLGNNPFIGYLTGATVAFILQSSSATIGILQAFSAGGQLPFKAIYAVIVGIYLGDCLTTGIVCSIGAKADAKRVGVVNILFNLSETAAVLAGVALLKNFTPLLNGLWERNVNPGIIANTNTIFNLTCALIFFPFVSVYEKMSRKIVRDDPEEENRYKEQLDALNPAFYDTPALALKSCYNALVVMFRAAKENINRAFSLLERYDESIAEEIAREEDAIDGMADRIGNYVASLSPHLESSEHTEIANEYYKAVTEFERLSDHAMNISETAGEMKNKGLKFSDMAMDELFVLKELLDEVIEATGRAFENRDEEEAGRVEPLEEVVDDVVVTLKENHLGRVSRGECSVLTGAVFMDILGDAERISDVCSNVAFAVLARIRPKEAGQVHDYAHVLHSGRNQMFNRIYGQKKNMYYRKLRGETAGSMEGEKDETGDI